MQAITTYLTFEKNGQAAVEFYTSIFKDSHIHSSMVLPDTGQLLHASFALNGQEFMAMDGGPHFKFEDGISLFITCKDQEEVDYYWDRLTADGGEPGRCGWLKDKFGVSWQVIPVALGQLMSDPDRAKSMRVREAMLQMSKIEVAGLQRAYEG
jgi:predicted 3-demethylubiquinone-9 3-methyltransferase (glyoxalase superfamily)